MSVKQSNTAYQTPAKVSDAPHIKPGLYHCYMGRSSANKHVFKLDLVS